ncbi:porin [uncultured Roseobacter sp.]|uniref:porin n=1 Tax=uncultured Roseobacter sp. TaxID=114847 RepID=UPI0026195C0C|nr:porin [uncultured Roseobacter sp.]
MKKILIATTALVATTTVAVAEVNISGLGRFGLDYQEDRTSDAGDENETVLDSRMRLNIDAETETDSGIEFGARLRIQSDNDESDGSSNVASFNGPRFHIESGGLRVEVGNISGVSDAASTINTYGFEPGLTFNTGHYSTWGANVAGLFPAYATGAEGANGVSAKYEMGDFVVMASYTDDYDENTAVTTDDESFAETFELGAAYTFSAWTLGAVYGMSEQTTVGVAEEIDFWALSASGAVGIADLVFFVGDTDAAGDDVAYGISAAIPVGAATVIEASVAGGGADALDTAYGLGFDHSLGGGVKLQGMVGRDTGGNTIADLGVLFNF